MKILLLAILGSLGVFVGMPLWTTVLMATTDSTSAHSYATVYFLISAVVGCTSLVFCILDILSSRGPDIVLAVSKDKLPRDLKAFIDGRTQERAGENS